MDSLAKLNKSKGECMTQREKSYWAAHKRKQGYEWIVVHWNDKWNGWIESQPMNYWAACAAVKAAREEARQNEKI